MEQERAYPSDHYTPPPAGQPKQQPFAAAGEVPESQAHGQAWQQRTYGYGAYEKGVNPYGKNSEHYWNASSNDRTLAVLTHVLSLLFPLLPSFVVFLVKNHEPGFVREHARQSLNLNLILALSYIASSILIFVLIGFLILPVVAIFGSVVQILAAIRAGQGQGYRMPLTPNWVK